MKWALSFLAFALALCTVGVVVARAVRRHDAATALRVRAERADDTFEAFCSSFARLPVSEPVLRAVYSALSTRLTGGPVPPRRFDRIWLDQGIEWPDELEELLRPAASPLGLDVIVSPAEFEKLHTVGDVVHWLERQQRAGTV